jgi:hypothetical protein
LLVALTAAALTPGCDVNNLNCYLALSIDSTGFSSSLQIGFTTPSGAFLSTSGPAGQGNLTYFIAMPFALQTVTVTFREGATFFQVNKTWNPQNPATFWQLVTEHRAK